MGQRRALFIREQAPISIQSGPSHRYQVECDYMKSRSIEIGRQPSYIGLIGEGQKSSQPARWADTVRPPSSHHTIAIRRLLLLPLDIALAPRHHRLMGIDRPAGSFLILLCTQSMAENCFEPPRHSPKQDRRVERPPTAHDIAYTHATALHPIPYRRDTIDRPDGGRGRRFSRKD